ncbi:MauE/DoxX family redox-associated membrane protein [Daejeonella oryzae]|uniref:MauE/DoxX family redox-associated membrane protein n=1 Tax=Daejeonella oryzae TaxID=1122943 RepID=UPI003898DB86
MLGLNFSLFLLIQFTIYIILIMLNVFGRIPCSCGGILEEMSWGQHLVFNLFFLLLTIIAIIHNSKERRLMGKVF